jgi:hypothetical protein
VMLRTDECEVDDYKSVPAALAAVNAREFM